VCKEFIDGINYEDDFGAEFSAAAGEGGHLGHKNISPSASPAAALTDSPDPLDLDRL
jgi:hypothetical protein